MHKKNIKPQPSLPTPPFLQVEGLPNFRDLGGYPVQGTREDSLGIAHVYDLWSSLEIEQSIKPENGGIGEWEGAQRVYTPVFMDEDYSPEAIAIRFKDFASKGSGGFVRAYSRILELGAQEDHPHTPFPTIFTHLAATPEPPPILVHCTAGKDRTGVLCALILSLCGVSDEVVAHEYSLTDIGLASRHEEFIGHLMKTNALKGDREGAERMISSRKENMLATLDKIRESYGSVEKYVIDNCRLSPDAVAQIRRNLIVNADSDEHGALDWESHAKLLA